MAIIKNIMAFPYLNTRSLFYKKIRHASSTRIP